MAGTPRLLIVDDDSATRYVLRMSLEAEWDIVGEAENGLKALQANDELRPDIVLLDISMPGMDGFAAAKRLKQASPSVHIIFVSSHFEAAYINQAFLVGAEGYVFKGVAVGELPFAIREVLAGRLFRPLTE